ncbi:acylneuraminate cytidylyltransferase family protein [Nitrosarchaeum sp.]|uniref:acylneuraminate cytidylyltransferase family protein n=1 Tax=Nitrosarchaeum sp. TaxID=2026886 RepID=UPI00247C5D77|nr:acylneuraminate cytidylyltransferase family protein [Nitrosarchaeum sp.]MCV0411925.1 acylneuraminate cytidylyltransferase family protein [Nitrosarchaeum sp.]
MKILSIIPARGGSKGVKNKNIKILANQPVLQYSIKASQNSKYINKTIVSTENQKIISLAKKLNCQVIIRPKKLATDTAKLEPVISNVLKQLETQENYVPDIVVLLQNTSPLRTSRHIDESIELFLKKQFDSLLSVTNSHNFLWKSKNEIGVPINYNPTQRPNRQEMKNQFVENGAIYITTYNAFKKSLCRISGKIGMYFMSPEDSYQIDSLDEFYFIETLMKNKN